MEVWEWKRVVIQVIHCYTTSHPKSTGLKQPCVSSHGSVAWMLSTRLFSLGVSPGAAGWWQLGLNSYEGWTGLTIDAPCGLVAQLEFPFQHLHVTFSCGKGLLTTWVVEILTSSLRAQREKVETSRALLKAKSRTETVSFCCRSCKSLRPMQSPREGNKTPLFMGGIAKKMYFHLSQYPLR